jgi:hypothetical protein
VNPFAPPVDDAPAPAPALAGTDLRFFAVSRNKFLVLCLATFGLYELYWFYQNWKRIKERMRSDIWPVARAFFALFFTHALLRDVTIAAAEADVRPRFKVQSAAWAFIGLTLMNRLPDPYSFVAVLAFLPLVPVQDTINEIHARVAPNADTNASFGLGNWIAIGVGVIVWVLSMAALFLPEEPSAP